MLFGGGSLVERTRLGELVGRGTDEDVKERTSKRRKRRARPDRERVRTRETETNEDNGDKIR